MSGGMQVERQSQTRDAQTRERDRANRGPQVMATTIA
jgi:hypothetical protein